MPRILFDHMCKKCTFEFEELVDTKDTAPVLCPECNSPSNRLISGTRIDPKLGVDSENFPTLGDKWAKVRYQRQKIEAKRARDNGPDA